MKTPEESFGPDTITVNEVKKAPGPIWHLVVALVFALLAGMVSILAESSPWEAIVLVGSGSAAGYLTNKIAIGLLFHPVTPLFGGRLYGIFYKRKDAFGGKLIDVTCERFVNPCLFKDMFRSEKVRKPILQHLSSTLTGFLDNNRETFRETLDNTCGRELREKWTDRAAIEVGENACSAFSSGFDPQELAKTLADFLQAVGHKSANTIAQTEDLHLRLAHLIVRKVHSSDLVTKVIEQLAETFEKWDESGKTLGNLVPEQLQKRLEDLITGRLREWAMGSLANYIAKKDNREWIGEIARQECERVLWSKVDSLNPIKKFFVKTFGDRELDNMVMEIPGMVDGYLGNLASYLPNSPIEKQITKALAERFPAIWDLEIGKLKGWFTEDEREEMLNYVTARLNDNPEGDLVHGVLARALAPLLRKPLRQLFEYHGSAEAPVEYTLEGIAEKVFLDEDIIGFLKTTFRIKARHVLQELINRPVSDLFGSPEAKVEIRESVEREIVPRLADTLIEKAGAIASHFPVREELEKVWNKLSNEDIRDSVKGTLSREFATLVNLGVSLGAMTGFLFAMASLLGIFII